MTTSSPAWDLLLRGGTVFDGHGGAPVREDVAIADGRVVARGVDLPVAQAREVVDATGRWVLPGLLDIHTHVDLEVELDPGLTEVVRHGTTTTVMSNCSLGLAFGNQRTDGPGPDRRLLRARREHPQARPRGCRREGRLDRPARLPRSPGHPAARGERRPDAPPLDAAHRGHGPGRARSAATPARRTSRRWSASSTTPWTPATSGSPPTRCPSTTWPTTPTARRRSRRSGPPTRSSAAWSRCCAGTTACGRPHRPKDSPPETIRTFLLARGRGKQRPVRLTAVAALDVASNRGLLRAREGPQPRHELEGRGRALPHAGAGGALQGVGRRADHAAVRGDRAAAAPQRARPRGRRGPPGHPRRPGLAGVVPAGVDRGQGRAGPGRPQAPLRSSRTSPSPGTSTT